MEGDGVTVLLKAMQDGDPEASEKLLPLIYAELRPDPLARLRLSPRLAISGTQQVNTVVFKMGLQED
jgi:hypothetical protein